MRERSMGKGASVGKEAVLAAWGRAGDIAARVGRVRMVTFSTACQKQYGRPCTRWEVARSWRL